MKRSSWKVAILGSILFFASIFLLGVSGGVANAEKRKGAPLPEYYGVYAVDKGQVFEVKGTQKAFFDFTPNVFFIVFAGPERFPIRTDVRLGKTSFIRKKIKLKTLSVSEFDFSTDVKSIVPYNLWDMLVDISSPSWNENDSDFQKYGIALREKPVANQPQMTQFVPRQPLSPGVYYLKVVGETEGWMWFRVGDANQIREYGRKNCVDAYYNAFDRIELPAMYAVTKPCCVLDNLRRASPTTESPQETPGPTQQKEKIGSQESSNAERRAKISRAAADTKVIVTQTLTYYRDKNQYPSNVAGLQNNGYVTSVLDPFSTATPPANYQYTLNGAAFAGQLNAYMTDDIRAWSVGPDGVSGTADDIGYSSQTGAFGWIYSTRNTSPPSPSPIQSSNSSEQITSGEFDSFQSVFERIRLNGPDLPEFKILHMSWGEWGQKGLIEGPAMKVLMSYDKSWVTESPDGTQFYALGRFSLNENEAFLVWAPREWPVKMYVVDPKTHALVTSDIVEYGPQDRGWQLDVETKFVDLNQDGNLDLLIRETGESFEPEDEPGCWEISFVAKLWEKDRFVESNLPNLRTLKEKYFKKKCRRVNPISR